MSDKDLVEPSAAIVAYLNPLVMQKSAKTSLYELAYGGTVNHSRLLSVREMLNDVLCKLDEVICKADELADQNEQSVRRLEGSNDMVVVGNPSELYCDGDGCYVCNGTRVFEGRKCDGIPF